MKKGFTLIELLAVIIILAIVALIATPIILNVIDESRKSANMSQVELLLGGAEQYYAHGILNDKIFDGSENIYLDIQTTNKKPENGNIKIDSDGNVYLAIYLDGICYTKGFNDESISLDDSVDSAENCVPYELPVGTEYEFAYTGSVQEFTALADGYYFFEAWGAQGGSNGTYLGSYGAYTSGYAYLNKDQTIYVQVGGQGKVATSFGDLDSYGYNGGGISSFYPEETAGAGSGGATDFRLVGGEWNNSISLSSRIMVAAGGVGNSNWINPVSNPAPGGGLIGYDGQEYRDGNNNNVYSNATGATQTSGGFAGIGLDTGANGIFGSGGVSQAVNTGHGSGGSGGYYGGGGGSYGDSIVGSGSSGSSYISGHTGAVAIKAENDQTPKDIGFDVRYIEIGSNGSSANSANHIVEIQAFTDDGTNVAFGKPVTSNYTELSNLPFSIVTDGDTNTDLYAATGTVTTVDLQSSYDLNDIKLWRYYKDGRLYNDTYVKVYNEDKSLWFYIHDYLIEGTYVETSAGKTFAVGCTTGTLDKNCSIHYSGLEFLNPIMIDGHGYNWSNVKEDFALMPTPDDSFYELNKGHLGNGYAKITFVYDKNTQIIEYTGSEQVINLDSGTYKFILAGAEGGRASLNSVLLSEGGSGAIVEGEITFNSNVTLYAHVGGRGGDATLTNNGIGGVAGYNGGGTGGSDTRDDDDAGAGGGATDIRLISGAWNDIEGLNSRIIVAGGGSGSMGGALGAPGSGIQSVDMRGQIVTENMIFGVGGTGENTSTNYSIAGSGGGGGYFGGIGSVKDIAVASGGTSYISGFEGVSSVASQFDSTLTGSENHYSGYSFVNGNMLPDSNVGDGYIVITKID